MNDWGDFEDLEDVVREISKEAVKEEQQFATNYFMEEVTKPAERRGQFGFTPVDSGRLMANTVVSIGSMDNKSYEIFDEDGTDTRVKAALKVGAADAYSKIYIQNNAEEDGKGYAAQADYKGWKRTPAYYFFTRSKELLFNKMEERNT